VSVSPVVLAVRALLRRRTIAPPVRREELPDRRTNARHSAPDPGPPPYRHAAPRPSGAAPALSWPRPGRVSPSGEGGHPAAIRPDTLGGMCREVKCKKCGRPSWKGCGLHVEQVLSHVPRADRCQCSAEPRTKRLSWLSR